MEAAARFQKERATTGKTETEKVRGGGKRESSREGQNQRERETDLSRIKISGWSLALQSVLAKTTTHMYKV